MYLSICLYICIYIYICLRNYTAHLQGNYSDVCIMHMTIYVVPYNNLSKAQDYLCCPTPGTRGRSLLRSSVQGLLFVPFARTSTTQARAFSVVGPSVWNGLPLSQRLLPRILSDTFYSSLKTLLFSRARVGSASE